MFGTVANNLTLLLGFAAVLWLINQSVEYARPADFTPPMMAYVGAVATIIIPAISNGYLLYNAVQGAQ